MANPRIGLIGAGYMAKAHADCYQHERTAELAIVAASRPERAEALARQYGVARWTTDWRDVIADPTLDAVDICVPNHLHYPIAMAALDQGLPFLIEKPLARTLDEAREIVAAWEKTPLVAVYGENFRFAPQYLLAKEVIAQGGIGRVVMVRINEIHNGPFHAQWFWDALPTGGGALIDMGIHGAFLAEWLTGDRVDYVSAEVATLKWHDKCRNDAEDTAFCTLRFRGGALAELISSWAAAGGIDNRAEIYGTAGTILLDTSRNVGGVKVYSEPGYGPAVDVAVTERPHVSSTTGWSTPIPDEWHALGYQAEVRHFLACLRGEAEPASTLRDGLRALALVDASYRAARAGQRWQVAAD